jgi:hypothetical protein
MNEEVKKPKIYRSETMLVRMQPNVKEDIKESVWKSQVRGSKKLYKSYSEWIEAAILEKLERSNVNE